MFAFPRLHVVVALEVVLLELADLALDSRPRPIVNRREPLVRGLGRVVDGVDVALHVGCSELVGGLGEEVVSEPQPVIHEAIRLLLILHEGLRDVHGDLAIHLQSATN